MEAFDVLIPEIVRGASEWVEDRYGRIAGWLAFWGLIVVLPVGCIALVVSLISLGR